MRITTGQVKARRRLLCRTGVSVSAGTRLEFEVTLQVELADHDPLLESVLLRLDGAASADTLAGAGAGAACFLELQFITPARTAEEALRGASDLVDRAFQGAKITRIVPAPDTQAHKFHSLQRLISSQCFHHCHHTGYQGPARWYWTERDLEDMKARAESGDEVDKGLGTRGDRRNIDLWITGRDLAWSYIKPLFEEFSIADVLTLGLHRHWPTARARELDVDSRQVLRAFRLYMLSLGQLGALMPAFDQRGGPGVEKYSKVPTGRRTEFERSDGSRGFAANADDRKEMQDVWKKHMKKGTSVEKVRHRGLTEHRAQSVSQNGPDAVVTVRGKSLLKISDRQLGLTDAMAGRNSRIHAAHPTPHASGVRVRFGLLIRALAPGEGPRWPWK